jgi:hypothetical protein
MDTRGGPVAGGSGQVDPGAGRATSFNFSEAGIYQNIEEFLTTKAQKEGITHCLIHRLRAANRRFDFAFVVSLS